MPTNGTTLERIIDGTRTYLRDFPKFFSAVVAKEGMGSTYRLPHKNVFENDLMVVITQASTSYTGALDRDGAIPTTSTFLYVLDQREGLIRITALPTGFTFNTTGVLYVEGYYTTWISEGDMRYFANNMIAEYSYDTTGWTLDLLPDAVEDALSLGTAVEAIWSLVMEYARDIDVNTPEAITLPVSERFRQAQSLLSQLIEKYKEKAHYLGVGLDRIQTYTLRRVSRQTNRLIPMYRDREWDDAGRPVRVFSPIDSGGGSVTPPDEFTPPATGTTSPIVSEFF